MQTEVRLIDAFTPSISSRFVDVLIYVLQTSARETLPSVTIDSLKCPRKCAWMYLGPWSQRS